MQPNNVINVNALHGQRWWRAAKGATEPVLAGVGLLFLAPLLVVVAVLIKLDSPGPVLFRQSRTGYLGRRFTLYKFRTMSADAESRKADLMSQNIHGASSPDFKVRNDPRVTRLGKFLRKTSIDEIPNLVNVVFGQLAIVGPRPTSFPIETYRPHHFYRLAVKPGITGLWQISGRADVDFDDRVKLDVAYINSYSASTDMKIFIKTFSRLLKPVGAY